MKVLNYTVTWLLVIFFMPSTAKAQKKSVKELAYSSSLYNRPVAPVRQLLILYRPELFEKKSLTLFMNKFRDSCMAHNVNAIFAETATDRADSLMPVSDLICRISIAQYKVTRTTLSANQKYVIPDLFPAKTKNFSVMGFTDARLENPIWKCYCNFGSMSLKKADNEAANCLFYCLKKDGIIN